MGHYYWRSLNGLQEWLCSVCLCSSGLVLSTLMQTDGQLLDWEIQWPFSDLAAGLLRGQIAIWASVEKVLKSLEKKQGTHWIKWDINLTLVSSINYGKSSLALLVLTRYFTFSKHSKYLILGIVIILLWNLFKCYYDHLMRENLFILKLNWLELIPLQDWQG